MTPDPRHDIKECIVPNFFCYQSIVVGSDEIKQEHWEDYLQIETAKFVSCSIDPKFEDWMNSVFFETPFSILAELELYNNTSLSWPSGPPTDTSTSQ